MAHYPQPLLYCALCQLFCGTFCISWVTPRCYEETHRPIARIQEVDGGKHFSCFRTYVKTLLQSGPAVKKLRQIVARTVQKYQTSPRRVFRTEHCSGRQFSASRMPDNDKGHR